ncbi:MAG: DUF4091 domain-containing protein [Acidobacteria bacterium]|nr:DUF4091 domain-containing protein [Acidobacteriota bacterium]
MNVGLKATISVFLPTCTAVIILALFAGKARTQELNWWTTHALVKVRPEDPPPPGKLQTAALYAGRNEFEPFQIVLRTEGFDIENVDAEPSDLKGPEGASIGQENVTLYLERYMKLDRPSSVEGEAGEWPDPLIPRVDRYVGERRNAFPFPLLRGRSQPIWVEVYVPLDTPLGDYNGAVRITASGAPGISVPITLHVWNFTLPSTSRLKTSFGFSGGGALKQHRGGYTNDEELYAITYLYTKAALWHRISLHGGTFIPPPFVETEGLVQVDWRRYDREVSPFLDGTVFSQREPLPGAKATSVDLRTHGGANTDEKKVLYWREWVRHFAEKGWLDRLFYYVWDEPPTRDYPQVALRAELARRADGRLRNLVTTPLNGILEAVIDIWTPLINCVDSKPGFPDFCEKDVPRPLYDRVIQEGKALWWYQSCASHGCNIVGEEYFRGWPSYVIDVSPVANRIMPWISWKQGVAGELYYSMNEAFSRDGDPWSNVYLFGGNGDGTLFYPGRPDRIGGSTDIPIESIRLKLIREGLEDYEYLTLLSAQCLSGWAANQVSQLVHAAYNWGKDPEILYAVRRKLGEKLDERMSRTAGGYKPLRINNCNFLDY